MRSILIDWLIDVCFVFSYFSSKFFFIWFIMSWKVIIFFGIRFMINLIWCMRHFFSWLSCLTELFLWFQWKRVIYSSLVLLLSFWLQNMKIFGIQRFVFNFHYLVSWDFICYTVSILITHLLQIKELLSIAPAAYSRTEFLAMVSLFTCLSIVVSVCVVFCYNLLSFFRRRLSF